MIPVKLTMRNFMCYRDNVPPLSFEGIHLVCLSGENGSGKSALIDAMTWALWGKTRARAKSASDDDLIAANQPEVEVDFEFAVGLQRYRIIRKHARPRKAGRQGQTALEFQIAEGENFKAISGDGKSQTQQKIINTLHMDYETFANSAYLRQGHADEFTIKTPEKRKQVLADILGLARYDELEQRAREAANRQDAAKRLLESTIGDIGGELAKKPAYEAEMAQAQDKLAHTAATAREKESVLNELRQQKETLQSKKTQLEELEARLDQSAAGLERWRTQAEQHRTRIQDYEAVISRRQAIEEGFAKFTEARKTSEELDNKLRASASLEKQKSRLEAAIREAGHALRTEQAVIGREITDLENKSQQLPELKARLGQLQSRSEQIAGQETTLQQKEAAGQTVKDRVGQLEAEIRRLEGEIAGIDERLGLLSSPTEAKCPLCETELTAERLALIAAKYADEKQVKSALLKTAQTELPQKQAELEARRREYAQSLKQLNDTKAEVKSQEGIIKNEMAEAEDASRRLASLRERLADIGRRLEKNDFAAREQAELEAVEKELAATGYDAARYEAAKQALRRLEAFEPDKRRLDEALRLIPQEKEALARAEAAIAENETGLVRMQEQKAALAQALAALPSLLDRLAAAEAEYHRLTAELSRAQESVGQAREKLQRLDEMEAKKKEKQQQLAQASSEEVIYQELAEAFGKKGIQAMLIETAFPEVEAEANRLLARMTDNRMHLKFETQRETRAGKGNIIETLDINIADELGTRDYDMFSGGEAFRINFAIRIALSRLLARRAGAPLRTLIIDEGFGTQDASGLEKLKEAINSIQDDFDKVIVITHVEELRDAFPSRIDVIKTVEGSTIQVS